MTRPDFARALVRAHRRLPLSHHRTIIVFDQPSLPIESEITMQRTAQVAERPSHQLSTRTSRRRTEPLSAVDNPFLQMQQQHGNRFTAQHIKAARATSDARPFSAVQRDRDDQPDDQSGGDDSLLGGLGLGGVGSTPACAANGNCPTGFCMTMPRLLAANARDSAAPGLLAGIAGMVSSRVVSLWAQYLFGGSAPQDLSGRFGADFTSSATTATATDFLIERLKFNLATDPPAFPDGSNVTTVDLPSRIGSALAELGNPASSNVMDFNVIGEIPGNIAGGVGTDQTTCPVGARPSPFNDDRSATGTATVTREANGTLTIVPSITFTVHDTIDLCPGN